MVHKANGSLRHAFLSKQKLGPSNAASRDGGKGEYDFFNDATLPKDLPHMLLRNIPREAFYQYGACPRGW